MVGRKWRTWVVLVVVGVAAAAALRPTLQSPFSRGAHRETASALHPGAEPRQPAQWPFHSFGVQALTRWSWRLDDIVWGPVAGGPGWTNLALHVVSGWLVAALALILLRSGAARDARPTVTHYGAALLAGLLFALHPLRVEPVVWVAQRATLLSGMWALAATLCYLHGATRAHRAWLGVALACGTLSFAAGSAGLTLPLVFVVLDWYPLRRLGLTAGWFSRRTRGVWLEKLPFVVLAAGALALGLAAQRAADTSPALGALERIAVAGRSATFYAWKTVWPHGLAPLYELHRPVPWLSWQFGGAAVAVLVALAVAVVVARKAPAVTAAALAYVLLLAPDAMLFPNGLLAAADRHGYLPGAIIALALGAALARLWAEHDALSRILATGATLAGCVAVGALGMLTWQQAQLWRDPRTLWRYTVDQYPGSGLAAWELARARERVGETQPAMQLYSAAVRLSPQVLELRLTLGAALLRESNTKAAIAAYQGAVQLAPQSAAAHFGLGAALAAGNDLAAAEEHLRRAQSLAPDDPRPPSSLGHLFMLQARWSEAAVAFQAALRMVPDDADLHYDLGHALDRAGARETAAAMFRRCLELSPNHGLARAALAAPTDPPTEPPPPPAATQTSRPSGRP